MKIRDYPELDIDLEANAYECVECMEVVVLTSGWDGEIECPNDEGHFVAPMLVIYTIPAGVPPEIAQDFWHYGTCRYEFGLEPA